MCFQIELQQQVEKSEAALDENKTGLAHWQRKLASLKLNEIDEDEDDDDEEVEEEVEQQQNNSAEKEGKEGEEGEDVDVEMKEGDEKGDEKGEGEKEEQNQETPKEQQNSERRLKRKRKEKNNSLPSELKTYSEEELNEFTADSLKAEVAVLEGKTMK